MWSHSRIYRCCVAGLSLSNCPFIFLYTLMAEELRSLKTNAKLYADDTSLISMVEISQTTASYINKDIEEKNKSASQWNVTFNSDSKKQAQAQDVISAEDVPSIENHKNKPSISTFEWYTAHHCWISEIPGSGSRT